MSKALTIVFAALSGTSRFTLAFGVGLFFLGWNVAGGQCQSKAFLFGVTWSSRTTGVPRLPNKTGGGALAV